MLQTTLCSLNSEEFQAMVLFAQFCQDLTLLKENPSLAASSLAHVSIGGIPQTKKPLDSHVLPRSDVS